MGTEEDFLGRIPERGIPDLPAQPPAESVIHCGPLNRNENKLAFLRDLCDSSEAGERQRIFYFETFFIKFFWPVR